MSLLPVTHWFGGHMDVTVASDTLVWCPDTWMSLLPVTHCFGGHMDVTVASDTLVWWTHGCHCCQ